MSFFHESMDMEGCAFCTEFFLPVLEENELMLKRIRLLERQLPAQPSGAAPSALPEDKVPEEEKVPASTPRPSSPFVLIETIETTGTSPQVRVVANPAYALVEKKNELTDEFMAMYESLLTKRDEINASIDLLDNEPLQRMAFLLELSRVQCDLDGCCRTFGLEMERVLHRYASQVIASGVCCTTNVDADDSIAHRSLNCEACGVSFSTLFVTSQRQCHRCKRPLCAACCSKTAYDMSWSGGVVVPGRVARAVCGSCHTECLRARTAEYAFVVTNAVGILPFDIFSSTTSETTNATPNTQLALQKARELESDVCRKLNESFGWFFASHRLDGESKSLVMFVDKEGAAQRVVQQVVPTLESVATVSADVLRRLMSG